MEKDDVPGNVDANQGIPKTAGKSNKELQDPSKLQVSGLLLSWTCCIYVCLHSAMVSNAVLSILRCRLNENRFPGCSINLRLWGLGSCWNKRKTVKRSKPILLTRAARSHQSCQQSAALHDSATIWCYVEGYFALLLRGRGPGLVWKDGWGKIKQNYIMMSSCWKRKKVQSDDTSSGVDLSLVLHPVACNRNHDLILCYLIYCHEVLISNHVAIILIGVDIRKWI